MILSRYSGGAVILHPIGIDRDLSIAIGNPRGRPTDAVSGGRKGRLVLPNL